MREERDTFGTVGVPEARLWGAQTARAVEHFGGFDERMPTALIVALAMVKSAAAHVNRELGLLDEARATAIGAAAEEVISGRLGEEFPLSLWQSGSGTQTNMNVNEVLANRASEWMGGPRGSGRRVHPNDHVNLGQSTNDVFPTAMHVAASIAIAREWLPALKELRDSLAERAARFRSIIKVGRTHLQDAVPITLGQEFSGYVAQLDAVREAMEAARGPLLRLAIGGTAVGTGINTAPAFGEKVADFLAARCALEFVSAENKFAQLAGHEALVTAHGVLKTGACALTKIANDIRWLSSGPRAGLYEISIPDNEPGSSIMPGKVNPTQCESVLMICAQVLGNDVVMGVAGSAGNFELNVMKPLIANAFLQSVNLMARGMRHFERFCVRDIVPNEARMKEALERSLMWVTALVPHVGYDAAAKIARHALASGCSLKEAACEMASVSEQDFDRWVQIEQMV